MFLDKVDKAIFRHHFDYDLRVRRTEFGSNAAHRKLGEQDWAATRKRPRGVDVAAFEEQLASYGPAWLAYDMRLMMAGIQKFGMQADEGTVDRLAIYWAPAAHLWSLRGHRWGLNG